MKIGRESLLNAFTHSHAESIQVQITYGDRELVIRSRDDGIGVDAEVLSLGQRAGRESKGTALT